MIGEVLALGNALAQASSNVTAGAAVRRSRPVGVLLVSTPVTVLIAFIVAVATGPLPDRGTLAWGASAGVAGGVGLWCSYRAFELGRVSVVVPVTTCAATAIQVGRAGCLRSSLRSGRW